MAKKNSKLKVQKQQNNKDKAMPCNNEEPCLENNVPDNDKRSLLLKSSATSFLIRKLVEQGIIPPSQFIKALVIARDNSFLQKYGVLLLALAGVLYILSSVIFFLIAKSEVIPFTLKPALSCTALIISCFIVSMASKDSILARIFMFFNFVFAGLLLYFGMMNTVSSGYLFSFFALWCASVTVWTFWARYIEILGFWFILLVTALLLWGYEYALPFQLFANWSEFFALCSILLFVLLAIEPCITSISSSKQTINSNSNGNQENSRHRQRQLWQQEAIRLTPLITSLTLALLPILLSAIGVQGGSIILSSTVLVLLLLISFIIYFKLLPNLQALSVIIFFACAFFAILALVTGFDYNRWYLSFFLIIIPFGFSSWFMLKLKNKKDEA